MYYCIRRTGVRDTLEFDQGHVTKNQSITVLVLLSESPVI